MITKLTTDQQQQLSTYRNRYFAQATSTDPADRARAEAAARRLAEIGGVKVQRVVWGDSPEECARAWRESFSASLRASLRDSLWDSLWDSLRVSLWASLWDSLCASLRASLSKSLWDSLRASLRASLSASLWDTGWLAYYSYAEKVLGVQYGERETELLSLYREVHESCFAVWIGLGTVVLCERPVSVEVDDGKLVGIEWRGINPPAPAGRDEES